MAPHLPSLPARLDPSRAGRLAASLLLTLALGCEKEGPTAIEEALSKRPEDDIKATNPKPRPKDKFGQPSDAELKAWDRKDPEGEKHLYKWDKANADKMMSYWEDITCLKEKMKEEGDKAFGAEPGSPQEEAWFQFKQSFVVPVVDSWQKRMFAEEGTRILEKSKLIGHFLEAHELVMREYPAAYNGSDKTELEKADAHWMIVEAKVKKYIGNLGIEDKFPTVDLDDPKSIERHAAHCEQTLAPPDTSGKAKKRQKRKKTSI